MNRANGKPFEPEQRAKVLGKLVRVTAARLGGGFVALVRAVRPRDLTVQRPGLSSSKTLSGRCCGEVLRVEWSEVEGVLDRRRHQLVPLAEFLGRGSS